MMKMECFRSEDDPNLWICQIGGGFRGGSLPIYVTDYMSDSPDADAEIRFERTGPTKEAAIADAVSYMKRCVSAFNDECQNFLRSLQD